MLTSFVFTILLRSTSWRGKNVADPGTSPSGATDFTAVIDISERYSVESLYSVVAGEFAVDA